MPLKYKWSDTDWMMIGKKDIRFTCGDDNTSVVFAFDAVEMDAQEMFMMWVRFMNAIGYVLDPAEMEDLWCSSK
jgi:hypothetical protein